MVNKEWKIPVPGKHKDFGPGDVPSRVPKWESNNYLLTYDSYVPLYWAQMALASLVPFKGPGVSRAPSPPLTQVIHSPYEIYYTRAHKNQWSIGSFM
jgi:hypothetical protein